MIERASSPIAAWLSIIGVVVSLILGRGVGCMLGKEQGTAFEQQGLVCEFSRDRIQRGKCGRQEIAKLLWGLFEYSPAPGFKTPSLQRLRSQPYRPGSPDLHTGLRGLFDAD